MAAQPAPHLAAVHPPTLEKLFDAIGEVFEFSAPGRSVWHSSDGEERAHRRRRRRTRSKRGPHTGPGTDPPRCPARCPRRAADREERGPRQRPAVGPCATRSAFARRSRWSRPPTRRRNVSTCERVSSSGRLAAFVTGRCRPRDVPRREWTERRRDRRVCPRTRSGRRRGGPRGRRR